MRGKRYSCCEDERDTVRVDNVVRELTAAGLAEIVIEQDGGEVYIVLKREDVRALRIDLQKIEEDYETAHTLTD